ncbi:MAG TPA: transglycosylase SLT domain-containing protein [Candidatus Acidoferrum sp.]|nr:transglycosylase SLT domain-containing protein [Candidatus Acidoferrum sp.]
MSSRKANVVRSGSIRIKWWVLAAAALCGFGILLPEAEAWPQSAPGSLQTQPATAPPKPAAQTTPDSGKTSDTSKTPAKRTTSARKPAASPAKHQLVNRKRRTVSPRVQRMRQAFVASTSLRPMAQQLLQDRSQPAYAGVDAFARAHAKDDAGALAWLVLGYAHVLDRDFAKAIDPLNRAKAHAGDLGDYVAYYLGNSYLQTGRTAEALVTLADFAKTHPDSLLVRDAQVHDADALLLEGQPAEAVTLLEQIRTPVRSDVEFALGRAYAASGQNPKAAETLANIYYTMPTSVEADAAYAELKKLPSVPQPTVTQLKTRADALMAKHRYAEAADEYRSLANAASPTDKPSMQLAYADALHRSGKNRDAKLVLALLGNGSGEPNAHRLYLLGQVAWAANDNDTFYRTVNELRQADPASPWLEQALLSAANLHLVHHEYDQALDAFREAQQRFPTGARASYVHWKAAWLTLRQGRNDDAKKAFEEQIALYPSGAETPAALYWRARLAEEDNQAAMARAFYQKLSDRYRNYYYAELGRQRLKHLPATSDAAGQYPLLDRVPPLDNSGKVADSEPPTDELHVQKAQLLGNGGLVDFAVRELQAAAATDGGSWGPAETAQLYDETGHYDQAIEVMKRSAPNYFALDIPDLPRKYWEALFPKAFWTDLKRSAAANGLDPYLVASLIRQESEFNPNAVSRANAVGLMQLLPKTGKLVAKEVKLKRYTASQLYTPAVNLQLGTRYFRSMVDKFGGFEYALAAYNAGSDRVEEWLGQGKYRDPQEFVESIPFTETREYVQAILRNASVYKQLYGTP